MTLEHLIPKTISMADGTVKRFYFAFQVLQPDFIRVFKKTADETFATLISPGNYTVTNLSRDAYNYGGYVDFEIAPTAGTQIIIMRETAETQENPFETASGFQADVVEDEFDKLTAIVQEQTEHLSHVYTLDVSDNRTDLRIENPVAGMYLQYDDNGNIINAEPPKDGKDGEKGADGKDGAREFITKTLALNEDGTSLIFTTDSPLQNGVEYIVNLTYEGELNGSSETITMKFNDNHYIKTYQQSLMDTVCLKDLSQCYWTEESSTVHRWWFRAIYTSKDGSLNIIPGVNVMTSYATTDYVDEVLGDIANALDAINGEVI